MYLQDIPSDNSWGICKVLLVRREMIHLKHIKKEVFIRRSVNIHKILEILNISLFEYIQYISNRENIIFKFNRDYVQDTPQDIVKLSNTFGAYLKLYKTLEKVVVYTDECFTAFTYLNISPTLIFNVREIVEASQKDNISIFVSNDIEKLTIAWCFGIKTFRVVNNKISHFSLKSDL